MTLLLLHDDCQSSCSCLSCRSLSLSLTKFLSGTSNCLNVIVVGIVVQSLLDIKNSAGLNPTASGVLWYASSEGRGHLPFLTIRL